MLFRSARKSSLAFTLIELAVVLGILGVVTAGLWRLMSTSNQQSKDQATAQQQLALITAVKGFLADTNLNTGGQTLLKATAVNTTIALPLPGANATLAACQASLAASNDVGICPYLPPGFTSGTTNPYGQNYLIMVKTGPVNPNQGYSFMIMTNVGAGSTIPDSDGGRISNLIGGDGGFIYSSSLCPNSVANKTACGSLGAWEVINVTATAALGGYGFATSTAGTVASQTYVATSALSYDWLARVPMPTDPTYTYNTMTTDIFMGPEQTGDDYIGSSAPSIHLHNGVIDGSGNSTLAQINLSQPAPPATPVDTPGPSLIQLSTGCSITNSSYESAPDASVQPPILAQGKPVCNPAISIYGDLGLSGQVEALSIVSSSDARLKTNIRPIHDSLSDLMRIDPVSFTFKAGGHKSMGVIAQNVQKVYPDLVTQGYNGTLFVEYNGLIGPLIAAVQELKRQNDDLRKEMNEQSARLNQIEHKNLSP